MTKKVGLSCTILFVEVPSFPHIIHSFASFCTSLHHTPQCFTHEIIRCLCFMVVEMLYGDILPIVFYGFFFQIIYSVLWCIWLE